MPSLRRMMFRIHHWRFRLSMRFVKQFIWFTIICAALAYLLHTWLSPLTYRAKRRSRGRANEQHLRGSHFRKFDKVADKIPPVPKFSKSLVVPHLDEDIMKKHLAYPKRKYNERVLIASHVTSWDISQGWLKNVLLSLTYPRHLVSVAMAMDVKDDTEQLELAEKELLALFPTVSAYILNLTDYVVDDMNKGNPQFKKRSRLAHARNMLVQAGLRESDDWVLWLDSGLISVPPDLIQQLLSAKKDVVTPLCLHHDVIRQKNVIYDLSTWRETHESYLQQKQLSMPDVLYTEKKPTKRIRLSDLRAEGRVVPVDGVGACALLVTANYFLNELGFPEKAFRHHIDTEGLAKMAQSMGYEVYGMPFVEVFH